MSEMEHIWERGIEPIMWLAGAWAPGYAIVKSGVPGMAFLTTINPFLYISEALRQLFLPGPQFAPIITCCVVMAGSSIVFTFIAYHLLKRRMDLV
jgi:ABC-type polysaccharide/polyol phosphate export permease